MLIDEIAIESLRNEQRQLDMDGVEVGVSRQALDELLAWYDADKVAALEAAKAAHQPVELSFQSLNTSVPCIQKIEEIERVAIALSQWRNDKDWLFAQWDSLSENVKEAYREQANAAITAMGEGPSNSAVESGESHVCAGSSPVLGVDTSPAKIPEIQEMMPCPYVNGFSADNSGVSYMLKCYGHYRDLVVFEDGAPARCFRFASTPKREISTEPVQSDCILNRSAWQPIEDVPEIGVYLVRGNRTPEHLRDSYHDLRPIVRVGRVSSGTVGAQVNQRFWSCLVTGLQIWPTEMIPLSEGSEL